MTPRTVVPRAVVPGAVAVGLAAVAVAASAVPVTAVPAPERPATTAQASVAGSGSGAAWWVPSESTTRVTLAYDSALRWVSPPTGFVLSRVCRTAQGRWMWAVVYADRTPAGWRVAHATASSGTGASPGAVPDWDPATSRVLTAGGRQVGLRLAASGLPWSPYCTVHL